MYLHHHWVIDWEKVKCLEDIITILKNLELGFERPDKDLEMLCNFVSKGDDQKLTLD